MNLGKLWRTLLCGALAATLSVGCGLAEAPGITLTDMMGREITLDAPATRVVALTAADCEILYALGAGDALVGRGEYCDYPEAALAVPTVQSGAETNLEQIFALNPQVLLMGAMAQSEQQVNQLEAAGVRVVVSDAQTIAGVYQEISMLGTLLARETEADALIGQMKDGFAALSEQAVGSGKTVYFEVSPLEYGLWTAGQGTFMDEVAGLLGLTNCFADVTGWAEVSQEQVIARNPDFIVTISMSFGDSPTPEEEIASRAGWENLAAVQNGAILNLPNNELTRPGPRLLDGAVKLSDFIRNALTQTPAA